MRLTRRSIRYSFGLVIDDPERTQEVDSQDDRDLVRFVKKDLRQKFWKQVLEEYKVETQESLLSIIAWIPTVPTDGIRC